MTTRRLVFSAVAIVFLLLPFARLDAAAMYKWVDKEGNIHITDYPDPYEAEAEALKERAQKLKTDEKIKSDDRKTKQLKDAKNAPPKTAIQNTAPAVPATTAVAKAPVANATTASPAVANAPAAKVDNAGVANAAVTNAPSAQTQRPSTLPNIQPMSQNPSGAIMAALAGFGLIAIALVAACLLLQVIGLFIVAKKLNVPAPWLAFIPFAQLYPLVVAAGKPAWWIAPVIFVPFFVLYVFMLIAERMGKSKFLGLIHLLPIIGTIIYWIILLRATPESSSQASQFTATDEHSSSTESFGQEGELQEDNPFKDLEQ